MIAIIFVLVFGTAIYQRVYYNAHEEESKLKGAMMSFVYWGIVMFGGVGAFAVTLFDMSTFVKVLMILGIVAAMCGLLYLMLKKRSGVLAQAYPGENFIAVKEMIASMGVLMGMVLAIVLIALPFITRPSRK